MKIEIDIKIVTILIVLFSIVQFLSTIWIKSSIENSISAKYDKVLEDYKYDTRVKEKSEKIAEYLALYIEDSQNFTRLNQLSMELSLLLPDDIYMSLYPALINVGPTMDTKKKKITDVLIDVRKLLLKDPGNLTSEHIIIHGKDLGKKTEQHNQLLQ